METKDPLAALESTDLHIRAAGCRDLSQVGMPDNIPLLARIAQTDKSPAVRLIAAGSAADILSRYRVGDEAKFLRDGDRKKLLTTFQGIDPSFNAGVFSMLACIGLPQGLERISAGLRDPRSGVRLGAAVGLKRLAASLQAHNDSKLEKQIVSLLEDQRLPPDALAELAKVCAAVGYESSKTIISALALPGAQGQLISDAITILDNNQGPMCGLWVSDGRDVGEINANPKIKPMEAILHPKKGAFLSKKDKWKWTPNFHMGDVRRMWLRRVGEAEPGPVAQFTTTKASGGDRRVWYHVSGRRPLTLASQLVDGSTLQWAPNTKPVTNGAKLAEALVDQLPETGPGFRSRALLLQAGGQTDAAFAALEAAKASNNCPPEALLFYADALAARDQKDEAIEIWKRLAKRGKKIDQDVCKAAKSRLS